MLNSFATVACAVQTGVNIDPKEPSCALSKVPLHRVDKALSKHNDSAPSELSGTVQEPAMSIEPDQQPPNSVTKPQDMQANDGEGNAFHVTIGNISSLFHGVKGEVDALKEQMLAMAQSMAQMQSTIDCLTGKARINDRLYIPPGGKTDRTEMADGSEMIILKKTLKRKAEEVDAPQEGAFVKCVEEKPTPGNTSCPAHERASAPNEGMQGMATVCKNEEDKSSGRKKARDITGNRASRESGLASQAPAKKSAKRQKNGPKNNPGCAPQGGTNGMEGSTGLSTGSKTCLMEAGVGKTGPCTPTRPNSQTINAACGGSGGSGSVGRGPNARAPRRGSGKRKRDNWTEDENNEFMRLVVENASMEEMELRRMLTRRFQPRRSHEQCANHLRILRAQFRLPAAKEEADGASKANN